MRSRKNRADCDSTDIAKAAAQLKESGLDYVPLTKADIKKLLNEAAYKAYCTTIKDWNIFAIKNLAEEDRNIELRKVPPTPHVEMYLTFMARSSTGYIVDKVNTVTMHNQFNKLKRVIKLHSNYTYTKRQTEYLNHHINKVLPITEGVSTKAHSKPVASFEVVEDLVQFIWKCDEYQFSHPRARLQLLFCIILFSHTGSRPGEVIESDAWRQSNEGLHYKDFQLRYQRAPDYTGLLLQLTLRNRKGKRSIDANNTVLCLYEEPGARYLCPVTYFLSFALADCAFKRPDFMTSLLNMRSHRGPVTVTFQIKPEMSEVPLLRTMNKDGTVSSENILTYACMNNSVKGAGERAGYEERLSAYCFRRGFGNAIDQAATQAQRNQLMGHTNSEVYQAYIPNVVGIDAQSLLRGRAPKTKLMALNQSMTLRLNPKAPKPVGSSLTDVRTSKEKQRDEISMQVLNISSAAQYHRRKQMRHKMYTKTRNEFFARADVPDDEEFIESLYGPGYERTPSRYLEAYLRYEPGREKIINLLFHNKDSEESSWGELVDLIAKEARPSKIRSTYPSVAIGNGNECPDCDKKLPVGPVRMNKHLLNCARQRRITKARADMKHQYESVIHTCQWNDCGYRFAWKTCGTYSLHITAHLEANKLHQCLWRGCGHLAQNYQDLALHVSLQHDVPNEWTIPTRFHFCYEHARWYMSERLWVHHMEDHLRMLNDYCGIIRLQGLVMVAANCLFCIGDESLPIQTRLNQFSDIFVLHKHLKEHLDSLESPLSRCPHPNCDDQSDSEGNLDFWDHATTVHGIPPLGPPNLQALKRKATDDEVSGSCGEVSN